jgi:3',5'-cyclic AMP phosphodiesterase CpdA
VFVLAHLSDPHLGPLPRPRLAELASKRLLGYANWRRSRHAVHRTDALDAIVGDMRRAAPDHVAVTGDLVNIALPFEFERARRWLDSLGSPERVSLVPGNHDAYVAAAARERERHWAPYMAGDEPVTRPAGGPAFPYLRRRGAVALIGLSTAVATPLLMATGRLGAAQIARLAEMLGRLSEAGLFRVVMIHHPPLAAPRHKRLIDAVSLCEAIAAGGAELVIHGHDHIREFARLPGRGVQIPAIGVPSASAVGGARHQAAAYNLYRIAGGPGDWRCEVISRGLGGDGTVTEIDRFALSWPQRE